VVAYLVGALVVLAVLAFVILPLLRRDRRAARPSPEVVTPSPAEQRAAIYRELTELELDQRVGKVTEADFQEQSEALLARAAALISEEDAETAALDAQIEREIAKARAALRPAPEASAPQAPS
jgi:cytochrome c-type biogenesis protein CcmI